MALRTSTLWRLLIVLSLCALSAVALASCGDSSITNPPGEPQPLRYQDEAEQLALYLQGTLHPPDWLTKQISQELSLIRDTWGDSIPVVAEEFQSPWFRNRVDILVDTALYIEIMNGSNDAWNGLVDELGLNIRDHEYSFFPRYLYTESSENLHPVRLAEYFIGFPGVVEVSTEQQYYHYFEGYVRKVVSDSIHYFFRQSLCPDLYHLYAFVTIVNDSAIYHGTHAECWTGDYEWLFSEYPGNSFYEFLIAWQDSAEANRPTWVDQAREAIREVSATRQFRWSRN